MGGVEASQSESSTGSNLEGWTWDTQGCHVRRNLSCVSDSTAVNFSLIIISFTWFLTASKLRAGVFQAFAMVNLVAVKICDANWRSGLSNSVIGFPRRAS